MATAPTAVPTTYAPPMITLAQALDIAHARDTNRDAIPETGEHAAGRVSFQRGDAAWSGSETLADAVRMCRFGWPEGSAKIIRAAASVIVADRMPEWRHDVAGMFPDVSAYCAGDPACMLDRTTEAGDTGARRQATIYLPCWYSAGTSTASINTIGAAMVGMIDALEVSGTACEIVMHGSFCNRNRNPSPVYCLRVQVKRHEDPLDIDRLAFCAASPAMMRRILFAMMETDTTTRYLTAGGSYAQGMEPGTVPDTLQPGPGVVILPSMGDPYWSRRGEVTAATVSAILREEATAAGLLMPE